MKETTEYLAKFFMKYDHFKREYFRRQIEHRKDGGLVKKYLVMAKEFPIEQHVDLVDPFFTYMMHKTSIFSVNRILNQIQRTDPKRFLFLSTILKNQVICGPN